MRPLDHIAQCTDPFLVRQNCADVWRLTGAADFSSAVARCPLRYVLAVELVRACVELAYSEGDELSGCQRSRQRIDVVVILRKPFS